MCEFIFNQFLKKDLDFDSELFNLLKTNDIIKFHQSLDGYVPTPLVSLNQMAEKYGVNEILVKDESKRFNVNAFKPLGASYAIYRLIKKEWEEKFESQFRHEYLFDTLKMSKLGGFVFSAATDGNHGRAVAWMANRIGQEAKIFMPKDTKQARIDNIEKEGAEVVIINGTYDDCVREVSIRSKKNIWYEVGDTAYNGYTEIPTWVAAGYSTIFNEIKEILDKGKFNIPDIVFLQAGVGAFAAAGTGFFRMNYKNKNIKLVCVEPIEAGGFFDSMKFGNGKAIEARGKMETIMAGLNCGIPSTIAWPVLKDSVNMFLTISDNYAEDAMREYENSGITSGESGASGLAGLLSIMNNEKLIEAKKKLDITKNTNILLISTEGNTDPETYNKIVT